MYTTNHNQPYWCHKTFCLKKRDRGQHANYRLIYLTSAYCKVMKHIIHSSILATLKNHPLIWATRFPQENITRNTASPHRQRPSKGARLWRPDRWHPFDNVSHKHLLMKLNLYGVRNNTLSWIQEFLSNRTQTVVLKGNSSYTDSVTSRVPQGTVLGHWLFLRILTTCQATPNP